MKRAFHSSWARLLAVAVLTAATQLGAWAQAAPTSTAAPTAPIEDIRDIRGPKAVPSPENWLWWIAGGAGLAALLYGAWRWRQRAGSLSKLPYEAALERLQIARLLMRVDSTREFSIEVSEVIRSYIEARFRVRAAHQTTEEFLHNLLQPADASLAGHQELLDDFLRHCDLAKFGRWVLSPEEMEEMYRSAWIFVMKTGRPLPNAPAENLAPA